MRSPFLLSQSTLSLQQNERVHKEVMRMMMKLLTKVCGGLNMRAPRRRRSFHKDVEQQREEEEGEFQIAGRCCLSSYYSVFVARLAIMVMLAILIGLLTILTWHFTRIYTNQSLNSLAGGLRYELLQRPVLRMWNILNSTSEITAAHVKLSQYVIKKYSTKPNNVQADQVELYEEMRAISWALFASRKALNAITINYRNGFVQAFHRDHRTNNTFYIYSDLVNYSIGAATGSNLDNSLLTSRRAWNDEEALHGNSSAIWYQEPLDPITGDKIGKARPIQPDDLINIAGLSQVPDGVASWHVAVSKYTDSPLLSAALPVWSAANDSIVAVVGVTTALYSVGQLMKELVEVHGGHIYLTSREGYLLATSTNAPLLTKATTKVPQLMMAVDCADDVIRMGAQWLQKEYGNQLPPDQVIHDENAKLGHEQYYIDSFFLNLKRLPIVGVIIIPRKYIMGKVDERAFKTLMILISASLCILFVGCISIFILTNGVSKELKLRAQLISHLDARRRAEASSNYKSQFLANMSHELRTPMAAVIGLLDILICDDCLTNEQYSTITQIRKCSTALLRLLNNILDLSKVESGKLVLENVEFDLGRELEGLVDMFSVQRLNHNVETVLDLSDNIPKMVRGDSARVVQIFANLLSNSIKFTTSGHILVRGWSESLTMTDEIGKFSPNLRKPHFVLSPKLKQHGNRMKKPGKKDSKFILWFEVDDTGCGIDPSKWESVFESFEQADPSTTRTHGGTGLGLCIVRTLVNKMGGEIKVVKKNGPGTLMRLYLVLDTPSDATELPCRTDFSTDQLVLILALHGNMTRSVTSQWLYKTSMLTLEASEWNELTQILHHLFPSSGSNNGLGCHPSVIESLRAKLKSIEGMATPVFIIVVDIGLLDLSTSIWKEQLNFLDKFTSEAKFAWLVSHDTSNSIKTELRRKGHDLMVNKPLYKTKMVQILESVVNEITPDTASHEGLDLESTNFDRCSSNDSAASDNTAFISYSKPRLLDIEETSAHGSSSSSPKAEECPRKTEKPGQNSLEGLRILLAEDTPVLQRVATIMLEKMGATVIAVGDGLQAVEALNCMLDVDQRADDCREHETIMKIDSTPPPYDLVLMDCQMPKMDGYEATMTIRKWEEGRGWHIPIVALTAHAMSSDEAKCLKVGMDAYLTKPIDYKLMVSTILSLNKPKT